MLISPTGIVFAWLLWLLSVVLLGGGLYLIWAWYVGVLVGTAYLVGGVAMTLLTFFGRPLVLLFVRPGRDEPRAIRADAAEITRPDGSMLHVETCGPVDVPPLVLTHGWGTNSTVWYYVKRHLAGRFRLVLWDLPGLGESRGPADNDYRLEKMAADLEAVVARVERPAVLVGHSIGGMILLTFCRLFPQHLGTRVVGLVLVDTTYTNPLATTTASGLLRALQKPVVEPLLHLTIWIAPLVWLMNWLSYLNGAGHLASKLTGFAGHETRGQLDFATLFTPTASPAVQARGALAMLRYDATTTLPTIPVPVLVLAGHLDRMTIPEAARYIRDHVPAGQYVELRPGGHMSILETNEQFDQLVGEFAAACSAAPAATPHRPADINVA